MDGKENVPPTALDRIHAPLYKWLAKVGLSGPHYSKKQRKRRAEIAHNQRRRQAEEWHKIIVGKAREAGFSAAPGCQIVRCFYTDSAYVQDHHDSFCDCAKKRKEYHERCARIHAKWLEGRA